jgi:hypothetical protein
VIDDSLNVYRTAQVMIAVVADTPPLLRISVIFRFGTENSPMQPALRYRAPTPLVAIKSGLAPGDMILDSGVSKARRLTYVTLRGQSDGQNEFRSANRFARTQRAEGGAYRF